MSLICQRGHHIDFPVLGTYTPKTLGEKGVPVPSLAAIVASCQSAAEYATP